MATIGVSSPAVTVEPTLLTDPIASLDDQRSSVDRLDPEFLTILDKKGKEPETEQNICDAFRVFDVKGNGLISSKKLKKIMTGMGEKLSDAEVDEMIRQAECFNGDGKVKYKKFVKMMMEA